jgi:signal transduction histidine kinase
MRKPLLETAPPARAGKTTARPEPLREGAVRTARLAMRLSGGSGSIVHLVRPGGLEPVASHGLVTAAGAAELEAGVTGEATGSRRPAVYADLGSSRMGIGPGLEGMHVLSCAAVPILSPADGLLGAVTVVDTKVRGWEDLQSLADVASSFGAELSYRVEADERTGAAEALRRQLLESAGLADVGRAVTGTLSLDDVLSLVVREAESLLRGACASVVLVEPDSPLLRVAAATGVLSGEVGSRVGRDSTLVGWVVERRETVITQNISDDPRVRAHDVRFGPAAVVPLVLRGEARGALLVARPQGAPPISRGAVEGLERLADYGAIAIENAQLHARTHAILEQERERVALLHALLETGNRLRVEHDLGSTLQRICDAIRDALGWEFVVIMRNDPETDTSSPAAVAGYEEEERRTILADDPTPLAGIRQLTDERFRISNSYYIDHRHIDFARAHAHIITTAPARETAPDEWNPEDNLVVPIALHGDVLGYISPDTPRNNRRPGIEEIHALELFSNQAAVAMENARLFHEQKETAAALRRQVGLLSALLETGNRLRVELDLGQLLTEICEAIRTTLGWRRVLLSLRREGGEAVQTLAGYEPSATREILERTPTPLETLRKLFREEYRVSNSYFLSHHHVAETRTSADLVVLDETDASDDEQWHGEDALVVPIILRGEMLGYISADLPEDELKPTLEAVQALELFANQAAVVIDNTRLYREQREKAAELERAYAELHASQEQLVVTEKMAALGRVTAGIAHEINSPLGGILNSLQLALGYTDEYERSAGDREVTADDHLQIARDLRDTLQLAEQATRKVGQFVRSIKEQTRDSRDQATLFRLEDEVQEALHLIAHVLSDAGVVVERDLEPNLVMMGDRGKFALILQNLLTNAVDAYEGRPGTVLIASRARADHLELTVKDEGSGIPEEIRGRVFDYLFTTKELGKGTGLGLSIVHSLMTNHFGGEITFQSEVRGGTTFVLRFPLGA